MHALSIRQPYAEEILQGIKTIEYRPNPTKKIGEKFFIYASMQLPKPADLKKFSKLYPDLEALKKAVRVAAGALFAQKRGYLPGVPAGEH